MNHVDDFLAPFNGSVFTLCIVMITLILYLIIWESASFPVSGVCVCVCVCVCKQETKQSFRVSRKYLPFTGSAKIDGASEPYAAAGLEPQTQSFTSKPSVFFHLQLPSASLN